MILQKSKWKEAKNFKAIPLLVTSCFRNKHQSDLKHSNYFYSTSNYLNYVSKIFLRSIHFRTNSVNINTGIIVSHFDGKIIFLK